MKKTRIAYDKLKRKQRWMSLLFFLIGILITVSIIAVMLIVYPKEFNALVNKETPTTTTSSTTHEIKQTNDSIETADIKPTFVPRTNFDNPSATPLLYKSLKDTLEQDIASRELSGTLLAIKNNQVVMYNSFGYAADIPWKAQESTYMIASLQKFYTAILISTLISEKKLTLETKLSEFYPDIQGSQNVTIDQLLTMTSGLTLDLGKAPNSIKTEKELHEYVIKNTINKNNNNWSYTPVNYSILAMIIEKITGKTYEEYFNMVVKEPLNLTQTGFYTDLSNDSHLVPVNEEDGTLRTSSIPDYAYVRELGTGNMFVSPKDFAIVVQAVMDGKFGDLQQIKSIWTKPDETYGTTYYKSGLYRQVLTTNGPTEFYGHGIFRGYEPTVAFNNDASDMIIYFSNQRFSNKANETATKEFYNIISQPVNFSE